MIFHRRRRGRVTTRQGLDATAGVRRARRIVTAPTTEVVGFYGFSTNALPPQCNFFITIPLSLFHFYGIYYYIIWLFNNINGIVLNGIHPTTKVVGSLPV